VAGLKKKGQTR